MDILTEHRCNMVSAAVSGVVLLLEQQEAALAALGGQLRWMEMGTGYLMPAHRRRLLEVLPTTRVFISYGLTEAIRCTFLELNAEGEKLESVGRPSPGIEVRVVDVHDEPVAVGQEGRIQVAGPNQASGYFAYEAAWREKARGPWLDTGDTGHLDADGYLTFTGRTDDMINVGGLKVAPDEVEAALKPFLAGMVYAVARIPDPEGVEGFVPALFVEGGDGVGPGLQEVREYLRGRLPNYKLPRAVFRLPALPRTQTTTKVRRAALAGMVATQVGGDVLAPAMARLAEVGLGHWPAVEGAVALTRAELRPLMEAPALSSEPLLQRFLAAVAEARASGAGPLWQASRHLEGVLVLGEGDAVAVEPDCVGHPMVAAGVVQVLALGGRVVLLTPGNVARAARDLGWIHRARARYVFLSLERLERIARAGMHLADSFSYPEFQALVLPAGAPGADLLHRFQQQFGCVPHLAREVAGRWFLERLAPEAAGGGEAAIWHRVRQLAASVFSAPIDSLGYGSVPERTPGWDSLGFVGLLAALKGVFEVRLSPRDVMAIKSLGDVVQVVAARTGGTGAPATRQVA